MRYVGVGPFHTAGFVVGNNFCMRLLNDVSSFQLFNCTAIFFQFLRGSFVGFISLSLVIYFGYKRNR